eukprot:6522279-Prymnesium_polylepis.2
MPRRELLQLHRPARRAVVLFGRRRATPSAVRHEVACAGLPHEPGGGLRGVRDRGLRDEGGEHVEARKRVRQPVVDGRDLDRIVAQPRGTSAQPI